MKNKKASRGILIDIALLRNMAAELGVTAIKQQRGALFYYVHTLGSAQLAALMQTYFSRISLNDKTKPYYVAIRLSREETAADLMLQIITILQKNAG